jgi:hypothetical protein
MKKKQIFIYTLLFSLIIIACKKESDPPTEPPSENGISGQVSGVWEKGKTYVITGHLEVPAGKSLTIEEGVKVIMSDSTNETEVIIRGNLYCLGTAANPVIFTVPDAWKTEDHLFGNLWGGLVCAPTSGEVLLQHTILEYGGAATTEESPSVKAGLYKATAGKHLPALYYGNVNGKFVVENTTIRNFYDDAIYDEGGQTIIANNTFYAIGAPADDAINLKSGVIADVAFNLIYSPNTSGLKLANEGERSPQLYVIGYNNTIINGGWRRPTIKGGSIWLEQSSHADLYNNMIANDRFGIKRDKGNPEDSRSKFFNTFYYGYTQEAVDQFQPSDEIIAGIDDIIGTKAGENDPKFVNYPLNTDLYNADFDPEWDFHLQPGSPALGKGKTDFTPNFRNGFTINGVTYQSPEPADYIGAFGEKNS